MSDALGSALTHGPLAAIFGSVSGVTILEVFVFFAIFLLVLRFIGGTRAEGILKGYLLLFLVAFFLLQWLAESFDLPRVNKLLDNVFQWTVILLVIIFQPELRRGLVRIVELNSFVGLFLKSDINPVEQVIEAALHMARNKVGALIAFERENGLKNYAEWGVKIDSEVSASLLETIFFPGSPLHDGAVIVREQRVVAAGCLFPLTDNPDVSRQLGT
ncbi:MAG: diadenylate cyclase, partial [Planctomycetota bacterium]